MLTYELDWYFNWKSKKELIRSSITKKSNIFKASVQAIIVLISPKLRPKELSRPSAYIAIVIEQYVILDAEITYPRLFPLIDLELTHW